ncbi:cytochrome P450 [Nocardiopsis sp. RSe5-2]|uniref:Cytochrome P450 n=1 Tax=Nocardiopsis endophytica TaxID=3018445 RepID=A0ABT4UDF9_9ACTN|nr:cytochrome P450 [Nocardiopsis endophytica]MDA2814776.1 cytochrome P450 [Nocardiopsis endophytica]
MPDARAAVPETVIRLPLERPGPLEPPRTYAALRESTPVAAARTADGAHAWLVTSYPAVARVLTDPAFGVTPPGGPHPDDHTLFRDGPAHARLRRLVARAFTPRRTAELRRRTEAAAARLAEGLERQGRPGDLVAGFAGPLAFGVVADLLGVAEDRRAALRGAADAVLLGGAGETLAAGGGGGEEAAQAWGALVAGVEELVEAERARSVGPYGLLGDLIRVNDSDDGALSDEELVAMGVVIVSAGYLSAANAVAVAAARAALEGWPEGVLPGAGEEQERAAVEAVLRGQAGLTGEAMPRWAAEDVDLEGVRIRRGEMVLARLEAAHADPRSAGEPSLAFGRGPHHCLGAALARMEVAVALRELASRFPGLALEVEPEDIPWVASMADEGPAELLVRW